MSHHFNQQKVKSNLIKYMLKKCETQNNPEWQNIKMQLCLHQHRRLWCFNPKKAEFHFVFDFFKHLRQLEP